MLPTVFDPVIRFVVVASIKQPVEIMLDPAVL